MFIFDIYRQLLIIRFFFWVFIILGLVFAFMVIAPIRDDTSKYLEIKRTAWVNIQSDQTPSGVKKTLIQTDKELNSIRCDKVEKQYVSECSKLKSEIIEAIPLLESNNKDDSAKSGVLNREIENIIKN